MPSSTYHTLALAHLATVLPAFLIGTALLLRKKGSPSHRLLGRVYVVLMLTTSVISLFMPAVVGPRWLGHFGFIHSFSIMVLVSVPMAVMAARAGNIRSHKISMVSVYVGGLLVAGGFAFMPGRILHNWLFA
jgi:uncharacterized membrane protein